MALGDVYWNRHHGLRFIKLEPKTCHLTRDLMNCLVLPRVIKMFRLVV